MSSIRFSVLLTLAIVLTGCGRNTRPDPPATYTVKRGDTLYSIAWRHDLDYRDVARWNRLPADFRIYPGQRLSLRPKAGGISAPVVRRSPPVSTPKRPPPKPRPPPQIPREEQVASWMWPVAGAFDYKRQAAVGSPSVLILGAEGREVRAAAPGKVVYTGSGIRGFGELVIVKHTAVFLSAYGHNRAVKVKEGDEVNAGQPIAEMGIGPHQAPVLYFEIRLNGQPVDPLLYLPRR